MPRRPPPPLEEERVEEILLRLAPHQPADLFRAALVCKRWRRLISSPAFRRRYREFHRAPPILAFLSNGVADDDPDDGGSRHASLLVTRPRTGSGSRGWAPGGLSRDVRVLDARHGRVLMQRVEDDDDDARRRVPVPVRNLFRRAAAMEEEDALRNTILYDRIGTPEEGARELLVSVPMSKERPREVPVPSQGLYTMAAAVLCADTTGACDHLDCRRGHFLVVLLGACRSATTFIYTYSSERLRLLHGAAQSPLTAKLAEHGWCPARTWGMRSTLGFATSNQSSSMIRSRDRSLGFNCQVCVVFISPMCSQPRSLVYWGWPPCVAPNSTFGPGRRMVLMWMRLGGHNPESLSSGTGSPWRTSWPSSYLV